LPTLLPGAELGVVQQLAINTVGGIVIAAQGLMVVVPHECGIEVLAQGPSRYIGFLRPGLPVAVKLDAFDFTKYGTLDGEVQRIGADAIKDDKAGQVFPVRIILRHTRLPVEVNGEHLALRIGKSVTADTQTNSSMECHRCCEYLIECKQGAGLFELQDILFSSSRAKTLVSKAFMARDAL